MQQHANFLAADTPSKPWGQNLTFSEHGRVAYQIKGNHKCINMIANILPTDPHIFLYYTLGELRGWRNGIYVFDLLVSLK